MRRLSASAPPDRKTGISYRQSDQVLVSEGDAPVFREQSRFDHRILKVATSMENRTPTNKSLPLVYSCSGCSSAAQMCNHLAIAMDRQGHAEMSCIAGVGGDVKSLVSLAKSGRRIVALDGCVLACVKNCLARHGVEAEQAYILSDYGVRKKKHADFDRAEAERVLARIVGDVTGATLATAEQH